MAAEQDIKDRKKGIEVIGPKTYFFISFLIWSIVFVPLSMGVFFMLEVFPKFTDLGNQYSVVIGLFVGLIVSAVVGYIYSTRASKVSQ
ncbi:MAG: hypothetical protein JXA22_10165 [Candidatus Thermoplasmatota archaeon]|nr:hypothetical protein [Candidatus Thermoplasmatota archaeon]